MKNIIGNIYINKIIPYIGKNVIKVLVGQRRVGKSFLLQQIIEKIKLKEPGANIISINKELDEFCK